jgi:hypothetical protein
MAKKMGYIGDTLRTFGIFLQVSKGGATLGVKVSVSLMLRD